MLKDECNTACPECYGKFRTGEPRCRQCEYRLSCRYYKVSGKHVESRDHFVSFEAAQEVRECADFDHIPGCERETDRSQEMISALGRFFRYMLDLDGYTLGIIAEVVSPSVPGTHCTVHHLGDLHGCSRQAMHRKLMKIIGARPELAGLFRNTLYKLSEARRSFLRRRAAGVAAK